MKRTEKETEFEDLTKEKIDKHDKLNYRKYNINYKYIIHLINSIK